MHSCAVSGHINDIFPISVAEKIDREFISGQIFLEYIIFLIPLNFASLLFEGPCLFLMTEISYPFPILNAGKRGLIRTGYSRSDKIDSFGITVFGTWQII